MPAMRATPPRPHGYFNSPGSEDFQGTSRSPSRSELGRRTGPGQLPSCPGGAAPRGVGGRPRILLALRDPDAEDGVRATPGFQGRTSGRPRGGGAQDLLPFPGDTEDDPDAP